MELQMFGGNQRMRLQGETIPHSVIKTTKHSLVKVPNISLFTADLTLHFCPLSFCRLESVTVSDAVYISYHNSLFYSLLSVLGCVNSPYLLCGGRQMNFCLIFAIPSEGKWMQSPHKVMSLTALTTETTHSLTVQRSYLWSNYYYYYQVWTCRVYSENKFLKNWIYF